MNGKEKIVPGEFVRLNEWVGRITAPNPGVMTGPGTNSYIVGQTELAVIDPGPESAVHCAALFQAVGNRLKWILCTHTHLDHSPGARALKAATGAELLGFARVPDDGRQDTAFTPDRALCEGDVLATRNFNVAVGGGGFFLRPIEAAAPAFGSPWTFYRFTRSATWIMPWRYSRASRTARSWCRRTFYGREPRIVIELAARYRLPAVYAFRNMAAEGGLMSYGRLAPLPTRSGLCGPCSPRRQAGRAADPSADRLRARPQPQNRQVHRPRCPERVLAAHQ